MGLLKSWLFSRRKFEVCHPGILCEPLEERIVLDAAAAATNQNQTTHTDYIQTQDLSVPTAAPVAEQGHSNAASDAQSHGSDDSGQVFQRDLHVVLVSDALDRLQVISDAAKEGSQVAAFDVTGDTLASINNMLGNLVSSSGQKIGELAILSHGTEGLVTLGSDQISFFNVSEFRSELGQLSTLMTADAQIHLYACSVAGNGLGKGLVDSLALLTGADVFASTDPTGGAAGDWILEYSTGPDVAMKSSFDPDRLGSVGVSLAASYPAYQDNWGQAMDGVLYFVNDDGVHGTELWAVTALGEPWMVKDINPGKADSNPAELTVYNNGLGNVLYFRATDGNNPSLDHGVELWRSDGTGPGTYLVKDLNPGGNKDSDPHWLTVSNGWLYFAASDGTGAGTFGNELFRTDGTAGNTLPVADINSGPGDSNPSHLTDVNGTLFFSATDGNSAGHYGVELWKSDGTTTSRVTDINPGNKDSNPDHFLNANGVLFFSATDGNSAADHGTELWKSDGSQAGTAMVMDINSGKGDGNPSGLVLVNGVVYFSADDGTYGNELWKSDGSEAGTSRVADINPGPKDSNPTGLTDVNGTLYFSATDGNSADDHGNELWKSDGSPVGTEMVKDINPGPADSAPKFINDYNGKALFVADDGQHGYELWQSDGFAAGTFLMKDINTNGSSFPLNFARLNPLFFLADDGTGFKLWRSDGTAEGTVKVSDVPTGSIVQNQPSGGTDSNDTTGAGGQKAQTDGLNLDTIGGKTSDIYSLGGVLRDRIKAENSGVYSPSEGTEEGATGSLAGVRKNAGSPSSAESGASESKWNSAGIGTLSEEPGNGTSTQEAQDQDARPTKWDRPLPGIIRVAVLENGDYSVRTDVFALVVGTEVWVPPMVRWYLSAVSEGRYRPGSLPPGVERMIWDFLQYSAGRKVEGQAPLSDLESKLAWQWSEWRRQLAKARGNVDVLPWDYFRGLSDAMVLFYGAGGSGEVDLNQAVNAMQQNIRNLTIIPIKLPEELLSKATEAPPGQ
ncbi:MAG: DUF4347 domain-containing protein [Desulfomonile tiedjei]|nr:DUF4347 domain-containing protein [Desulfomonile tiedjei]